MEHKQLLIKFRQFFATKSKEELEDIAFDLLRVLHPDDVIEIAEDLGLIE